MSILTHDDIVKEMNLGNIRFHPRISPDQIKEASVDLHLSEFFRVFEKINQVVEITDAADYRKITKPIKTRELMLHPHETVLGITREKISLPGNICAWIEGRSRFARLGLLIHISAGLIQPGVSNQQVLEITNLSPNTLMLKEGERICQLVFQRTSGNSVYQGRFKTQNKP
ncbi:dCTP deaminase [Candidatus Microgenomates bacterium]|nr:dCTP deaminase [Candidatus Microgenomates bacterium]